MPYDPGTHNRAGEIYAKFMGDAAMAAAQLRFQGAQSMAQGISSAGSSLGKGIQSFGEQWQKDAYTRDFMGAGMQGFAEKGLVSPEMMEKFHKAPLGAQAGMYAQSAALYDTYLKSQQAEEAVGRNLRQFQGEKDIERQGLNTPTYVPVDPNDASKGWKMLTIQTGPTSVTPVTEPKERVVPNQPDPVFFEGKAYGHKLAPGGYWVPDYSKPLTDDKGNLLVPRAPGVSLAPEAQEQLTRAIQEKLQPGR
jgi:hypothetical protein